MPKLTKQQIITNLQNTLEEATREWAEVKGQLIHVGNYARDAGLFSAEDDDTQPAVFGSPEYSEALDQVRTHIVYSRNELKQLKDRNTLLESQLKELREKVERQQGVMKQQGDEIERLGARVCTVAGGLKRRHEAIQVVLEHDPPGDLIDAEPMPEETQQLMQQLLRIANID